MDTDKPAQADSELPDGWRAEWRKPKRREKKREEEQRTLEGSPACIDRTRARAQPGEMALRHAIAVVGTPLPGREALHEIALRTLHAVATNPGEFGGARVAAAKALREATQEDPMAILLGLLKGDKVSLRRWLEAALAGLDDGE